MNLIFDIVTKISRGQLLVMYKLSVKFDEHRPKHSVVINWKPFLH